ncbi:MAG: type I DNA topoisomerase, partial [Clostridia bacterium]|nr:type I DNA topoisomerase [Clostridia bacterium]
PSSKCRIEFHEVTKAAVKSAIGNPRSIDMSLVDAQQARRALDRLVGYEISPLLWAKIKKGLSAGRVQSVVTRMVVLREKEIDAFIPEEYWDLSAIGATEKKDKRGFQMSLSTLDGQKASLHCAEDAENAKERVLNASLSVSSVRSSEKRKMPPAPFTTSSLQQEASKKLNFTTAKTMQVVQQLYEGVELKGSGSTGLVTYIRTDSVRLSQEAQADIRAFIPEKFGEEYLPETPNEFKGRKNAQDAHEAIRPTDIRRIPESIKESLSKDQYKLYKLVYDRTLASQMSSAAYETMTAEISGDGVGLRFYGEVLTFDGYRAVYKDSQDEEEVPVSSTLPSIAPGSPVSIREADVKQHFTQPPARYTEASLVRTMEEKGIGRPSTYAPTITTIISRGYVSREQKRLYPTELGNMVTAMMEEFFPEIVDMDFTADMEDKLDKVEEGTEEWKDILRKFYPHFKELLTTAEEQVEKVEIRDEVSDEICDKCGAKMVYKMGRFGRFLACPNFPECKNTKPIQIYIDVPCPNCGARLMEKTTKKNRKFFGCERYPECDFVSWDRPVEEKCPQCGSFMVEKHGKHQELWHVCTNETCRFRKEIPAASEVQDNSEAEEL